MRERGKDKKNKKKNKEGAEIRGVLVFKILKLKYVQKAARSHASHEFSTSNDQEN